MASNFNEGALREVMRHVPSPVTVVTFSSTSGPRGVTIGSFTSVSLVPPLISFNVMLESTAHDELVKADNYTIHILHEEQALLSDHFAIPKMLSADQFESVEFKIDRHGVPQLADVLARIQCRSFNVFAAGDHSLILGEVLQAEVEREGRPLIYYQRGYREIGSIVDSEAAGQKTSRS